jgi:hypothetical protein
MTTQQQIKSLKQSGIKLTQIAMATGYSTGYVSKVYRGRIDAAPRFRSALRSNIIGEQKDLAKENQQLRELVEQLQSKLNEIKGIVNR